MRSDNRRSSLQQIKTKSTDLQCGLEVMLILRYSYLWLQHGLRQTCTFSTELSYLLSSTHQSVGNTSSGGIYRKWSWCETHYLKIGGDIFYAASNVLNKNNAMA
jgi:hypothetical protein